MVTTVKQITFIVYIQIVSRHTCCRYVTMKENACLILTSFDFVSVHQEDCAHIVSSKLLEMKLKT